LEAVAFFVLDVKGFVSRNNALFLLVWFWLASSRMKGEASFDVFILGIHLPWSLIIFDDDHGGIELRSGG
jgi:hypothetical protein